MSLEKLSSPAPSLPIPRTNTPLASGGPASISPRRPASPSRWASACCTARSARAVSAAVTRSTGQRPARSHSPISSAWRRLARRKPGHQPGALLDRHRVLLGAQDLQRAVGAVLAQQTEDARLGAERLAEKRAAGEHGAEQLQVGVERRLHERRKRGIGGAGGDVPPALQPALGRSRIGGSRWREQGWTQARGLWRARGGVAGSAATPSRVNPGPPTSPAACPGRAGRRCCGSEHAPVGTSMRIFLKILVGLCLVVALAVGGLLWRLDQGPLSLSFMQPVLHYLIDRGLPYAVTFTDPQLVWLRQDDSIGLEVRNVEARTPEGELVAAAPLVRASVAVPPLLFEQRFQPVDVELDLPEIELTRGSDRKLSAAVRPAAGGGALGCCRGRRRAGHAARRKRRDRRSAAREPAPGAGHGPVAAVRGRGDR